MSNVYLFECGNCGYTVATFIKPVSVSCKCGQHPEPQIMTKAEYQKYQADKEKAAKSGKRGGRTK